MPTVALTQHNFQQVVTHNNIVLIDWWAGWCGPCRQFAPVFEASARDHPQIVHGKVDIEAEPELTATAQVDRFPTLMAFREGLLVFSEPGFLPSAALEEVVRQIRWLDMDALRGATAGQLAVPHDQVDAAGQVAVLGERHAGLASGPVRYGWPGL